MHRLSCLLILSIVAAAVSGCDQAATPVPGSTIAPEEARTFTLEPIDTPEPVYLLVAGRFDDKGEGWPRQGVSIVFNGVTLTDVRLVAPAPTWSNLASPFLPHPQRLFNPEKRSWAFRPDNDYLANNAAARTKSTTPGYALVFDVTKLVADRDNRVRVVNRRGDKPFLLRTAELSTDFMDRLAEVNRFADDFTETVVPGWAYLYYHDEDIRQAASAAFKDNDVKRAELEVSLALVALHEGDRERYVNHLQTALATADNFPNRNMVRYALVAEGIEPPPAKPARRWPRNIATNVLRYGGSTLWDRRLRTLRALRMDMPLPDDALATTTIPKVAKGSEITIDGKGDEVVWARGREIAVGTPIGGGGPEATTRPAYVTLLYTDEALYARFQGALPPNPVGPVGEGAGTHVWNTNAVEFFFSPWVAPYRYFELNADVYDKGWTTNTKMAYPRTKLVNWQGEPKYGPIDWQHAARVNGRQFTIEYRIPFSELGVDAPSEGDIWTGNIVFLQWNRDDGRKVNRVSFWSGLPAYDFHYWPGYGFMTFE